MTSPWRWLATVAAGAAATAGTRAALGALEPGGRERWERTNHRGEPISLLEGPAALAGLLAGAVVAQQAPSRRAAQVLAVAGAGAFGIYDDLAEDPSSRSKGLRGHLTSALHGDLTTGGLKVLGIGGTALLAAAVGRDRTASGAGQVVDVVLDGALVAASANMVNLLDLRPGRALKAGALGATAMTLAGFGASPGAVLGTAAAAARADLDERDMLGDGGANALGALLGSTLALHAPRPVRATALVALVALTVASERVSFSAVIARTPWLDAVDRWGRRAPAAPVSAPE